MAYPQLLAAVSIRSAVLLPAILVSMILFELNVPMGLFIFYAVGIWGFTVMIQAIANGIPAQKKNAFAHMMSVVIFAFLILAIFVMSKMWTYYLPDMIRTAMKSVGDLFSDPSQLMNFLSDMM